MTQPPACHLQSPSPPVLPPQWSRCWTSTIPRSPWQDRRSGGTVWVGGYRSSDHISRTSSQCVCCLPWRARFHCGLAVVPPTARTGRFVKMDAGWPPRPSDAATLWTSVASQVFFFFNLASSQIILNMFFFFTDAGGVYWNGSIKINKYM